MDYSEESRKRDKDLFRLSKNLRIFVYVLLIIVSILINMIISLLSSASKEIKSSYDINDFKFGLINIFSGIGKILGMFICIKFKPKFNLKILLILTSFGNGFLLLLIKTLFKYGYFYGIKTFLSILEAILNMMIPIWIDRFVFARYKFLFMYILQFSVVFGKVLSFYINYYFEWTNILIIEGVIFTVISLFFLITPHKYFSSKTLILLTQENNEEFFTKNIDLNGDDNPKNYPLLVSMTSSGSIQESIGSLSKKIGIKESKFLSLIKNKVYVFSLLLHIILLSIQSVILFWFPDYIDRVLKIDDTRGLNLFGNILIIIGFFLGNFLCKIFLTRNFSINNYVILSIFYCISFILSFLLTLSNDIIEDAAKGTSNIKFISNTIFYSFTSSFCLPILQYLSVNKNPQKNFSFIITHCFLLIFGNSLPPFIFGIFYNKATESENTIKKSYIINFFKYFLMGHFILGFLILIALDFYGHKEKQKSIKEKKSFSVGSFYTTNYKSIVDSRGNSELNEVY